MWTPSYPRDYEGPRYSHSIPAITVRQLPRLEACGFAIDQRDAFAVLAAIHVDDETASRAFRDRSDLDARFANRCQSLLQGNILCDTTIGDRLGGNR